VASGGGSLRGRGEVAPVKPPASRDPGVDRTQGVAELREGRVEVLRRTVLTPFRHDCEEDAEEHGGRDRARASAARTTVRDGRRRRSHPLGDMNPNTKGGRERTRAVPRWGRPGGSEEAVRTPPPRATASRNRDRAGGPGRGTEVPGQARRESRADRAGTPKRPAKTVAKRGPRKPGPRNAQAPPAARKGGSTTHEFWKERERLPKRRGAALGVPRARLVWPRFP